MKKIFALFNLSLPSRLILAAAAYALCVLIQLASGSVLAGFVLLVPAWLVLGMRTIKNKPDDQGLENWRAVGAAEVHRIADTLEQTRAMQRKLSGPGCLLVLLWLGSFGLAFLFRVFMEGTALQPLWLAALDLGLFLIPAVFSGNVQLFMPHELAMRMGVFLPLMNEKLPAGYVFTPYIRFDEDKNKQEIPEDIRFMLELKRKPEGFVGVQFQVAINKGPNGAVPYLYAVALFHGKNSKLYRLFSDISVKGYEVECGGDDQYGTVVVRQKTGGTGYHTKADDCRRLFAVILQALEKLLPLL